MKFIAKHISIIVAIIFFCLAYCFWAIGYRGLLSFHEQYQMFLFTGDYLCEHLAWPGGMATYLAEFLVQFYNNYWIGAAIISLAFIFCAILVNKICSNSIKGDRHKPILIPGYLCTLALWLAYGDIALLASFHVALLASLALGLCATRIKSLPTLCIYAAFVIPICYWLFGTTAYLLTALICLKAYYLNISSTKKLSLSVAFIANLGIWMLATRNCVLYSTEQVLIGINYYRMIDHPSIMPLSLMTLYFVVIAFAPLWNKLGNVANIAIAVATIALFAVAIPLFYDKETKTMVDYSAMVRTNDWTGIIAKSEREQPTWPLTVSATNLALGMTGQIANRAFDFYQNTAEGLIPPFTKEANTTLVSAEIYFQLGLINTAQRFYFEAMESNPIYAKSSRCIKRLAETALIRGDYALSRKYLGLLDKTLFYKKWAQRTLKLVDNPELIDQHPLYGKLRARMIDDDFMYSDAEIDKILGQLYLANTTNDLARDYLMLHPMLNRDIPRTMQYIDVVQQHTPYMPSIVQQAIAFAYMQSGQTLPQGIISPAIQQNFANFAKTYTQHKNDSQLLQPYKSTLWYYLVSSN